MAGLVKLNTSGVPSTEQINHIVNVMLAESRYTLQDDGVMKSRVRSYSLGDHEGPSLNIPRYGTVTAYDLTEGVDMQQAQTITDSKVTITPGEVGIQIILSDKSARHAKDDLTRVSGKLMGDAMVRKLDSDLAGLLVSFTKQFGGAGATPYPGMLLAANAYLRGRDQPAPGDISAVMRPEQYHAIAKNLAGVQASGAMQVGAKPTDMAETILKNYWMNSIGNVNIFIDNNIKRDANDDASGGIFSKEALIHLQVTQPTTETQRRASLRATEIDMVCEYGFGLYEDSWGIELISDSADPTS